MGKKPSNKHTSDYREDAYSTDRSRYDNGISRRIADNLTRDDIRSYFRAGSDYRHGTVSNRKVSGKRLLGERLSDDLEPGVAAMLTEIILAGFQATHSAELNDEQLKDLGNSLRYHMHKHPKLPQIIFSELEYIKIEDDMMGAPGEFGYIEDTVDID